MKLPQTPEAWLDFFHPIAEIPGFSELIRSHIPPCFSSGYHGDFPRWEAALAALPEFENISATLNEPTVRVSPKSPLSPETLAALEAQLQTFHPWRKGPFDLCGVHIDTEWRSDWKWARLENAITPLTQRTVLDIGAGSGYHLWRMVSAGARLAIGIEPMLLYVLQFLVVKHFIPNTPAHNLPLGIESMPTTCRDAFDTIFSMGVLYHRKNPLEHLEQVKQWLRPGGEFVLETLVIEGDAQSVLVPEDRYAQMRNVWFIPSPALLERWLKRTGFKNVRLIDVTPTTPDEQRSTEWMRFDSLNTFLNPENPQLTCEGYPAPLRALFIANK